MVHSVALGSYIAELGPQLCHLLMCVKLGNKLSLSGPQFPQLQDGIIIHPHGFAVRTVNIADEPLPEMANTSIELPLEGTWQQ